MHELFEKEQLRIDKQIMLPSRIRQAKSPLQMLMSTSPPFLEYPFYLMHVLLPPQFEYPFLSATLKDLLYLQIKVCFFLELLNQLLNGCRKPWSKLRSELSH